MQVLLWKVQVLRRVRPLGRTAPNESCSASRIERHRDEWRELVLCVLSFSRPLAWVERGHAVLGCALAGMRDLEDS
jgi:hypothetical protein